jgi:hypothetical protein
VDEPEIIERSANGLGIPELTQSRPSSEHAPNLGSFPGEMALVGKGAGGMDGRQGGMERSIVLVGKGEGGSPCPAGSSLSTMISRRRFIGVFFHGTRRTSRSLSTAFGGSLGAFSRSEFLLVAQTAPFRAILGVLYPSPFTECRRSTRISAPVSRACFRLTVFVLRIKTRTLGIGQETRTWCFAAARHRSLEK